jgi:hypothetical protein
MIQEIGKTVLNLFQMPTLDDNQSNQSTSLFAYEYPSISIQNSDTTLSLPLKAATRLYTLSINQKVSNQKDIITANVLDPSHHTVYGLSSGINLTEWNNDSNWDDSDEL